ncbi:MAG: DUF1549 and DUF1553 domain-containing protein [Pirellulales bacterium]
MTGRLVWLTFCTIGCILDAPEASRANEPPSPRPSLAVYPGEFALHGAAARQRLIVSSAEPGQAVNRHQDVTQRVEFYSASPDVVQVDSQGIATPVGDGAGIVVVRLGDLEARAKVEVRNAGRALPVSFELDVQPILTARGCNAGACHGKARGQNGFQLSLLGFDSDFDYEALTKNARGRRIFPAAPERSLLLEKPTVALPHGGGERLTEGGDDYHTLHRWVAEGAPRRLEGEAQLERIDLYPAERHLRTEERQQLVVTAYYTDGSSRDVTSRTTYQSNESAVVGVDEAGLIQAGPIPGEAAIMARYMGMIATCDIAIPLPGRVPEPVYASLPRNNFIDELVWDKLQSLRITPAEPADDAKFLRRVTTDIIGRLPTPEEIREFLADQRPNKREAVIDTLLDRPEYADYWANKWVDLLRPNPYRVGIKAVLNYDNWIRQSFRENKPYDQFVRELVTAQGSTWHNGATTLFRDRRSPDEVTTLVSQLFLGIRLECAKCHHHPFEKWAQADFYSFAAYFARVGRKGTGLSPPISGSEEMILVSTDGAVTHPLTGEELPPTPLFGSAADPEKLDDPRVALAEWMTSDENPFFAQVIVNRVWADLMGRGIVEPVDDLRATNPPTNGPLLDALADQFRQQDYDLKELIRTITSSYVYQLSSVPTERNLADTRNYSRHYRRRLRAEVLLDAVHDITGVPASFDAMPPNARATQIWTHRVDSLFLDTFGRPDPNQDPPCERTGETTVTQALHLINAPDIHRQVTSDEGRAAQLAESDHSPDEIVEEVYLWVFNRMPEEEERQVAGTLFAEEGVSRRQATEDLMWALMNTAEFIFND